MANWTNSATTLRMIQGFGVPVTSGYECDTASLWMNIVAEVFTINGNDRYLFAHEQPYTNGRTDLVIKRIEQNNQGLAGYFGRPFIAIEFKAAELVPSWVMARQQLTAYMLDTVNFLAADRLANGQIVNYTDFPIYIGNYKRFGIAAAGNLVKVYEWRFTLQNSLTKGIWELVQMTAFTELLLGNEVNVNCPREADGVTPRTLNLANDGPMLVRILGYMKRKGPQ